MADVYLARLVGPGGFEKRLVVKVIRPELAERREFCEMFVAEAKITVSLTHANIVPVYELGIIEGQYFLAMELVDGPTVHQLVFDPERGGPVPAPLAAYLVEQVLRGLDYAHRKGVVHRDLSSANVLCSRDGEVKIVDFGIAAHLLSRQPLRLKGGSAGYMAPEQQQGAELDGRTDLYAAGVLLAEVVTGRRFAQLPPLAELAEAPYRVPLPLLQIIETATQPDKAARFPDAAAMMQPLSRYLREGDPPTQADLSRLVRRRVPDERRLTRGTPSRLLALLTQAEVPLRPPGPRTPPVTRPLTRPLPAQRRPQGEALPTERPGSLAPSALAPPLASPEEAPPRPALPPAGGTVIFAGRPPRTHATWRTYLGAAVLLAGLIGAGLVGHSRWAPRSKRPQFPELPGMLHLGLPPGATLRVDGQVQPVGKPLPLPPGRHHVEADAPGRQPVRLTVEIRAGETLRERLVLPWTMGHLHLESVPPAAVSLNGQAVGTTPLDLDVPLDRTAVLRLSARGHVPLQHEIPPSQWVAASQQARMGASGGEPDDGQPPRLRLRLQLEPLGRGLLTVGATPWAQVFIDGERRGDTPLRRVPLAAGSHALRLYCPPPGCPEPQELRQHITVEPGREVRRIVDFRVRPPAIKE